MKTTTTTKATETKTILFGDIIRMQMAGEEITDALLRKLAYAVTYGELCPGYDGCTMENIAEMASAQRALKARLDALKASDAAATTVASPAPVRAAWGSRGVRYDEPCARCGKVSTVDNMTEVCEHCA